MPRSSNATVVPTGISLPMFCPTCWSAIETNLRPASIKDPKSCASVPDGSLNGRGIIELLISPPGASISLNSPGLRGSSSFRILNPLALKPAGRLARVPESINCRKILVAARPKPPIICIKPNP